MRHRVILDLCSGTGAWSQPYVDAGYDVERIDLPTDVRLIYYPGQVHGILAAPPCTVFSLAGNRWPRTREQYLEALSVVDACLRLVAICHPKWWALENPVGKLSKWLGAPSMMFHPCDFGDPYHKRTAVWGSFRPLQERFTWAHKGSWTNYAMKDAKRRSITPAGFAKAFFEANP